MMKTKIIIQRHGESAGNANHLYLGHTDMPLTEKGREQARLAAESLRDEKIDVIYSSDLSRAYQTAEPHAALRGLSINTSDQLREVFAGDWEGLPNDEIVEKYTKEFFTRRTYRDFVYPGGESIPELSLRMYNEIVKIAKENEGKTILIVSHSAAIRSFWYYFCGYTTENTVDSVGFMVNTSYSIFYYEDGKFIPGEYGLAPHLPKDTKYLV